jgi:hypothetical protein
MNDNYCMIESNVDIIVNLLKNIDMHEAVRKQIIERLNSISDLAYDMQ